LRITCELIQLIDEIEDKKMKVSVNHYIEHILLDAYRLHAMHYTSRWGHL